LPTLPGYPFFTTTLFYRLPAIKELPIKIKVYGCFIAFAKGFFALTLEGSFLLGRITFVHLAIAKKQLISLVTLGKGEGKHRRKKFI
jgi:hypothetical protein